MFRIIGPNAKDLCDAHLQPSRRDLLRVGARACSVFRSAHY